MSIRPVPSNARLLPWVMALVIFGVVLLCYWPALHGAILWDDPAHIPRLELRDWAGLRAIYSWLGLA